VKVELGNLLVFQPSLILTVFVGAVVKVWCFVIDPIVVGRELSEIKPRCTRQRPELRGSTKVGREERFRPTRIFGIK